MFARITVIALCVVIVAPSSTHGANATIRIFGDQPVDISDGGAILLKSNSIYLPRYSSLVAKNGALIEFDAFGSATAAVAVSADGTIVAGHGSFLESPYYLAWLKHDGEAFVNLGTL